MTNPFATIMMQQIQKAQEQLQRIQQEFSEQRITGEAGGGLVKVITTGQGDALEVFIDDSVYQEKKEVLQGLLAAAITDAKIKRERLRSEKMRQVLGSMGLPANFNFPFMS